MRKFNLLPFLIMVLGFVACNNEEESETVVSVDKVVNFRGSMKPVSRATETAFEETDAISIFAVSPSSNIRLEPYGNYADNVRYEYKGGSFISGTPITIREDNTEGLAYYAVYPYGVDVKDIFEFAVSSNQSEHIDYTNSDLCTAYNPPTADDYVNLEFSHRLSNIVVKFHGDNLAARNISVRLEKVMVNCHADINANTYEPFGDPGSVVMGEESTNAFHAIIVPQTIPADQHFMTVTMDGDEYEMTLATDAVCKSGKQLVLEYEVQDNKIIELSGYINPWDTEDPRFDDVVPDTIANKLGEYIPIYAGINPPIVEGAFLIDPFVTVYCEDYANDEGGFEPGTKVTSRCIRFSNQNTVENTLDYDSYTVSGSSNDSGTGAFISGSGDKFTAFFNTVGTSSGIYTKEALIISGTKTEEGIKDLYYAFVMVEKGEDSEDILMDEGVFRVFKDSDGLSVNTSFDDSYLTRAVANALLYDVNSRFVRDSGK